MCDIKAIYGKIEFLDLPMKFDIPYDYCICMLLYQMVIALKKPLPPLPSGLVMKGRFAFLPQPSSQTISCPHAQQMLLDLAVQLRFEGLTP